MAPIRKGVLREQQSHDGAARSVLQVDFASGDLFVCKLLDSLMQALKHGELEGGHGFGFLIGDALCCNVGLNPTLLTPRADCGIHEHKVREKGEP